MKILPLLLLTATLLQAERQVAITIDDLPVAPGSPENCEFRNVRAVTERLLKPLSGAKIPFIGFAIGGNCPNLTDAQYAEILRMWTAAGGEIGNHSWSHPSLSKVPAETYEKDILRADERLRKLTGRKIEYFRSPYLHTGPTPEIAGRLQRFLAAHGYKQSPVTFDNSDWMFAAVLLQARKKGDKELEARVLREYVPYMESTVEFFESRAVEMSGREFPQILLMHANQLNAEKLPELLAMFRRRGYKFVSMREALKDPVYETKNTYAGTGGISWIHRWTKSIDKKLPPRAEPNEPKWLQEAYAP